MRRFVFLFVSALTATAATTVTDTLCSGNNARVSWIKFSQTGAQVGQSFPIFYTAGVYSQSFAAGTDGSRYFVTIQCPSGGTSAAGHWLIPDTVSVLTVAKVAVAEDVRIDAGWFWDPGTLTWKNVAAGISGGGATAWGGITGTLSAQTDLNSALNATKPLNQGGTNQTTWTASRCVQVNAGNTALEAAGAPCGSLVAGPSGALDTTTTPGQIDVTSLVPLLANANAFTGFQRFVPTVKSVTTGAAPFACDMNQVEFDATGDFTNTNVPNIADGLPGQICTITNRDTTNIYTLQSESALTGSNLSLCAPTFTFMPNGTAQGGTLSLVWNSTLGLWIQLGCSGGETVYMGDSNTTGAGATTWSGVAGGTLGSGPTINRQFVLPYPGVLSLLRCTLAGTQGTNNAAVTLMKNGVATAITFNIVGGDLAGVTRGDAVNTATVSATTDLWVMRRIQGAAGTSPPVSCTMKYLH